MDLTDPAREYIEELARRKGTFTESFRRQAEEEAESGRPTLLQVIQGSEENREDLSNALQMLVHSFLLISRC